MPWCSFSPGVNIQILEMALTITQFWIHIYHLYFSNVTYPRCIPFLFSHTKFEYQSILGLVIFIENGAKDLMPYNCGVGEDSWDSLGKQGDQSSQS